MFPLGITARFERNFNEIGQIFFRDSMTNKQTYCKFTNDGKNINASNLIYDEAYCIIFISGVC